MDVSHYPEIVSRSSEHIPDLQYSTDIVLVPYCFHFPHLEFTPIGEFLQLGSTQVPNQVSIWRGFKLSPRMLSMTVY